MRRAIEAMDPRDLVGRTQGARKRAARLAAFLSTVPEFGFQRRRMLRVFRRDRLGELLADEYRAARARYRIGERLRPCRGCGWCQPGALACKGYDVPGSTHCDGSGVLPARRGK